MSGSASDVQWFIARDGTQHGPVTDAEFRKIVELAHLKPTDLVWRQGFTDWRAASSVFPELAQPEPPAPQPAQSAAEPTAPAAAQASVTTSVTQAPTTQATVTQAPTAHTPTAQAAAPAREPASLDGSNIRTQARPASGSAPQEGRHPERETSPADPMATRPLGNPTVRAAGPLPATGPGGATTYPADLAASRTTTDSRRPELSAQQRPAPPSAGRGGKVALVATGLVAMIGVGFWLSSEYKDDVFTYMQADDAEPGRDAEPQAAATTATASTLAPSPVAAPETTAAVQTVAATPHSPEDIDRKLQSRAMWASVKQEFPDWYQERIAEVARLSAENKEPAEITRYLVAELVTLRRENAKYALAASTTRHKELAAAFLANLTQLSQESGDDCYEFISKGESSPTIVARMDDPAKSAEIEAQVTAVVGAIAEGRKQPAEHAAPVKTDYDVLAGELGRLGWTQADMQLFANPKALAQAPRARVCSMLKDWFTAHLAIQDPSTQERLLFETLKPVISG